MEIELAIDEANELLFNVQVEGTTDPAKIRLICNNDIDESISYMFSGTAISADVVKFDIPVLEGKVKEGTYNSSIEVLIGSRLFSPIDFDIKFKRPIKVEINENVTKVVVPKKQSEVSVSATPIKVVPRSTTNIIENIDKKAKKHIVTKLKQKIKNDTIDQFEDFVNETIKK